MSLTPTPATILKDLVAFRTISGSSNLNMIEYLETWVRKAGFSTQRIGHPSDPERSNLLCMAGPQTAGGLMLCGHTDVVPVSGQNWHSDPFAMTEREGLLLGRGTTDMKGFIAATCHALSRLALHQLSKPLSLLFSYDEELGCQGSAVAAPLLKKYLPQLPAAALIGEPTDFSVLRMHSGHVTVKIWAKGKGAHSSDPALGISAIKALNLVLTGIFAFERELENEKSMHEYFVRPYVILNVGQIAGGSAVNIIPDEAFAIIGFRPLPDSSVEKIMDRIRMVAEQYAEGSGAVINIIQEHISPAMITRAGTRLEQILLPLAKQSTQVAAAFSTDAGNLNQQGIECLIFGPGNINIAHQANEFIKKADLDCASEKISQIIEKYLTT